MQETEMLADAELVALCRGGDRDAFGRIVERYQSLICALAYSACGDLNRSEDLAQETFITAWRQLVALREPDKLKGWLCGIVRNLTRSLARDQSRNPLAAAVNLEDEVAAGPEWEAPIDEAMSKEEEAILWRVLETLPRPYRDPLVLFYRSGDSTTEVADALELSEEAVRQRLSRGRAMLNERVTRLVESGLRRSNPTKAFTIGVLAALPLASAQAGVASAASAAVKGTGVFKSAGGLSTVLASLTGILPALGGFVGLWGHIQNTCTARERRFVAWSCLGLVAWAIALGVGAGLVSVGSESFGLRVDRAGIELSNAIRLSLFWLAFCGPLDAYAIWIALRQKRIRSEESQSPQRPLETARRGFRLSMYGSMFAMTFGTTGWLLLVAQRAHDWPALGALIVVTLGGWLGCAGLATRQPTTQARVMNAFIYLWWGLAFLNLAVFNLRFNAWQAGLAPAAPPDMRVFFNVLICVFFGSVRAAWFLKWRLLNAPTVKRDSLVALSLYAAVMLAGVALHQGIRIGEVSELQSTQCMINELQPDGNIRFQSLCDFRNDSPAPLRELRFCNSDFVQVERISGFGRHSLPFTVDRQNHTLEYLASLDKPLQPGKTFFLQTQGILTNQVRKLDGSVLEYSEQHWPANGLVTLRVETYRLPASAEIVETQPADMAQRRRPDGRTELRTQSLIPPGGSISVRIRYRLSR